MKRTETKAGARMPASARVAGNVVSHWRWRPEWGTDRPCWYWYLTFEPHMIERVVDGDDLARVRATAWLDPVPFRWLHLTVCDVGFADELESSVVEEVCDSVTATLGDVGRPWLRLGPVDVLQSAVVLRADGGDQLRSLQQGVGDATARVLGPDVSLVHRHGFSPHVTLGYVNRPADRGQVAALVTDMAPVFATVRPVGVALVAVTRRGGHYQWTPRAGARQPANPSWV